MSDYLKLLRVKHYIKNLIIFLPLFFSGKMYSLERFLSALLGFVTFSVLSSVIYIVNDYRDLESDKKHPIKKNRPMASGRISPRRAMLVAALLMGIIVLLTMVGGNIYAAMCLAFYFAMNIAYSMGLKNRPIIDVVILAFGFVIRVIFGAVIVNITISGWLYLVIVTGSLFMGLGKRRNELRIQTNTRKVLAYYNESFLDKNMYVCLGLTVAFYSLWSIDLSNSWMIWTVPVFLVILMQYSLDIEKSTDGDPVEVILRDKTLIATILVYAIVMFSFLYIV